MYDNEDIDELYNFYRQRSEQLPIKIPAGVRDSSSCGPNPQGQAENFSATTWLSPVQRPVEADPLVLWTRQEAVAALKRAQPLDPTSSGKEKAQTPKLRLPFVLRTQSGKMVLNLKFKDRVSYARDVDQGKKLVARLIRSSWSHDNILEGLKTVGPLLRLCSASYKAHVWLGDILENLRAQCRPKLVAFLEVNPGFKVHGKRIPFTRRVKPKENNSGGRNGGARSSQGEQVRLVFVFRAADTDACTPVKQLRFDPEEAEMCEEEQEEEQGSEGEKERAGTDYDDDDDEYSETMRLAEQTYPTLPNARLCWLGDTGADDLSRDLQRLLNSATELCRYDKTFSSTQKHVHPHIEKFAQDLAKLQLSAETNGLNRDDLDNGGAQFGHGKLGLTELAETREYLANWPNWSIRDVVTRRWNCIAAIARDEFAHVRRKGKATARNGDDGQTLAKVKVGYIFRAAMVPTVQDVMKTVEQALDEHKKETRGEVESESATTSSNTSRSKRPAGATGAGSSVAKKRAKLTDDATLQQLPSAIPDQINKTIATPLAKKHGRGNLPKHASPKTVATQPVSKTLGRLRVPASDTEYYGQSH
ncbi:BQ5605_C026g10133 [Microbotryum silenes-dioicae]|uniref:BQ5605_C026g10133 protein n=1 Tax=Microbotryum silenes-dioicae TaxID=796604 RepID=A0A2X0PLX6_9BASI|nr:BQ5605_C026g10133 [Microbotryum silenes-dioicae]